MYRIACWLIDGIALAISKRLHPKCLPLPMVIVFEAIIAVLVVRELIKKFRD